MANIEAPNNEATKTANAYGGDKDNTPIVFSIPVYNNMPVSACDIPSGGKNPNNYLKNLYVQGHAFSAPFALGDTGSKTYKTTVANKVKSVKVVASAVSTRDYRWARIRSSLRLSQPVARHVLTKLL